MNIYVLMIQRKGYELKVFVAAESVDLAATAAQRWYGPVVSAQPLTKEVADVA